MGTFRINFAEKKLLKHFRLGGAPNDDVGRRLVLYFCTKAWSDPTVAPALRQHGVTIQELALMYSEVIYYLMPRPWMNVGGPMLVPTQWFMEPHRIENLLVEVTRDTAGKDREVWLSAFINRAQQLAEDTRKAHDEAYGRPRISIVRAGGLKSGPGCLVVILAATALMVAFVV